MATNPFLTWCTWKFQGIFLLGTTHFGSRDLVFTWAPPFSNRVIPCQINQYLGDLKVHVSEIHQILTIHSPGTWNMFSKKTKQFHKNGGCNAPLYTWGGRQKSKIAFVFQVCFQMPLGRKIMQLEVWKFQCWEIFCIRFRVQNHRQTTHPGLRKLSNMLLFNSSEQLQKHIQCWQWYIQVYNFYYLYSGSLTTGIQYVRHLWRIVSE